jgi:DNA-binding Xre family transcriptional regulator
MRREGLPLQEWLKEQLKSPSFRKGYEKEYLRAGLALRISQLRRQKHISQAELARRLHTTQQTISDIETCKHTNITLNTLQRIAQALEVRLHIDLR